jgi:para-nitrobenzyl esterase
VGEYVAKGVGATNLAALRAMDADTLLKKAVATGFDPGANIDGWVLQRQIVESFDRGEQARVPVIIGFNAGEIRSLRYLLPPLPSTAAEYEAKVRHLYGNLAQRYLQLYPSTNIEQSALAASRDGLYGWTSERVVRKQTQLGMPAYLYFFEHQYPVEVTLHLEAFHASELPYEFGVVFPGGAGLPRSWPRPPDDAQQRALSEAFMNYITRFARTGKPSAPGQPDWHPYSDDEAFLDIRDKPYPAKHIMPGMFALQEEVVTRRRRAGTENWYVNVGLAAPVLPEAGK